MIFLVNDIRSLRRKRKWGRESLEKDGVKIEALNIPCGKLPKKILLNIRTAIVKKLYDRCVKKYGKPDIVHAHFLEISYATAKALNNQHIPLVMTEHLSTLNNEVIPANLIKWGKDTYCHYDKVIAVGKRIARTIEDNFGIKAEIVPNIADTDSFSFAESIPHDGFRIVSVGALIPRKHMDLLIKAFVRLYQQHHDVFLEIFGKGEERENLERLIAENQMKSVIVLHGARPRKEIAESMQKADCFVLASDVETFGVVYIEAMAMGLPVIATKSGGPENFVSKDNGILIESGNEELLANALETMYSHYPTYNKADIRRYVLENFSPDAVAEKLDRIYSSIKKLSTGK